MIFLGAAVGIAAAGLYLTLADRASASGGSQTPATDLSNALDRSASPYLLQHADNPVAWQAWSDQAFEHARRQGKPVFLSVGYSTCHWCHVMAHESFENEQVAAVLNEHFVPIKVDREQLPDVDARYMLATQAFYALQGMPRGGGWPNSVWLTPDGRPFYAGTYFPRDQFVRLLERIAELWRDDRDAVEQNAQAMVRAMDRLREMELARAELDPNAIDRAFEQFMKHRDTERGGLGGAPKFPPHGVLRLALDRHRHTHDAAARTFINTTLDAMRRGGIHDHVGGGFHRYSTDPHWLVPHFEKMLYDNAQLLGIYADAATMTGDANDRRVVEDIFGWVGREMTHDRGAFLTAIDADSEGEEGKFYVWTTSQVREALGDEDAELFIDVYGMQDRGNWAEESTGRATGTNIAHLPRSIDDYAAAHDTEAAALRERLGGLRDSLLTVRNRRVWPHIDDKVLAGWNGLMIEALADAGRLLQEPRYIDAANAAAGFILQAMTDDAGGLQRAWRDGQLSGPGYLDDYAWFINGLLSLHEATDDPRWLDEARRLADVMIERFGDADPGSTGGFFYTAASHDDRLPRTKTTGGGGNTPDPNGSAARALLRLARLTGDLRYARLAHETLAAFAGAMAHQPHGNESLLLAYAMLQHDPGLSPPADRGGAVGVKVLAPDGPVAPGSRAALTVQLTIAGPYHIYGPDPGMDDLTPTVVRVADATGLRPGAPRYPEARKVRDAVFDRDLSVYEGVVEFVVPVEVADDAVDRAAVELELTWQACDDKTCQAPRSERVEVELRVGR